jgi:hypothetical protein
MFRGPARSGPVASGKGVDSTYRLRKRRGNLMRAVLVVAASLLFVIPPGVTAGEALVPAEEGPGLGAKVWVGRYAEFEEYLRTAPIERMEKVGQGVTNPDRAFFAPGGLAECALIKVLRPARVRGYWESYKSEIAAYEVDRLLGLDMVPVTVERRVHGDEASAQLWLNGCRLLKEAGEERPPRVRQWGRQVCRQRIFDALIANIDRNAGNILIDDQWNVILIDHSRAFSQNEMPRFEDIIQTDREIFEALKGLDLETVMARLKPWLPGERALRQLLERRDKIVERLETLARKRGEAAVFTF